MSDTVVIDVVLPEEVKQYLIRQAVERLHHDAAKEQFITFEQTLHGDFETAFVHSTYNDIIIDVLIEAAFNELQLNLF